MFPAVMKDVTKWLVSLNLHPEYKKHRFAVVTDGYVLSDYCWTVEHSDNPRR